MKLVCINVKKQTKKLHVRTTIQSDSGIYQN